MKLMEKMQNHIIVKQGKKNKKLKIAYEYFVICLLAIASSLCFHIFILSNNFAPAGINGLCAMIQHKFGISIGYLGFLINIYLILKNPTFAQYYFNI